MEIPDATRSRSALVLARRVSGWPFVRVDLDPGRRRAAVRSGARDDEIARLDLETGALTARVRGERRPALIDAEPLLRAARDGVALDVVDDASRRAGERLIRWQIGHERFGAQLREASP